MTTKFDLGQVIKQQGDPDGDFGQITDILVNASGVVYTISIKDFDVNTRTLVDAVKHVLEGDAVAKPAEATPGAAGNPGEGVAA